MGMFRVPVIVVGADGREAEPIDAWVDTAAVLSQLPAELLERMGYRPDTVVRFKMADGSSSESPIGDIRLRFESEVRGVTCVFGEPGADALLGATALEVLRLEPDTNAKTLRPVLGLMLTMLPEDAP